MEGGGLERFGGEEDVPPHCAALRKRNGVTLGEAGSRLSLVCILIRIREKLPGRMEREREREREREGTHALARF